MNSNNSYLAPVWADMPRLRRAAAMESPEAFAEVYLKSHCSEPFSRMHRELFGHLEQMMKKRPGRLAIAAPRGHAKTTIVSLAFVLWCVLYAEEKLVLIVSATEGQAKQRLRDIKEEIQKNPMLLEDFPDVCVPPGAGRQPKPWRANGIVLRNGAMILVYGAGQGLRGAKHGSDRPGLIVVDDIEDPQEVISEEQRQKLQKWFSATLLHAGHPQTNVVVVGTVLHHDSLLANLVHPDKGHGWSGLIYKAIECFSDRPDLWERWSAIFCGREEYEDKTGPDAATAFFDDNREEMLKGTEVLWPELEDYHALMVTREREGRASFQAEKQNEPLDPQQCMFSEQNFHYWDNEYPDEQSLLDAVGRDGYFYGACDPSMGRRHGDYTAIVILYQPRQASVYYLLVADLARRSPDETIERIVRYAGMYRFSCFAVESNSFQELMVTNLERRVAEANVTLPVVPVASRSNKQSRIAALEPEVTQGRIKLCRRHQILLDQLREFPLGVHDDGPDALEMAFQMTQYLILPDKPQLITLSPGNW